MNLDYFVIVDPDSGTFFGAASAILLDTRKLDEDELDDLNDGTDNDRARLAEKYGTYIDELINHA